MISPLERYRGGLLGLAAADAVGTTVEFRLPGSFEPVQDMVGGGPFGLKAGEWTDDTSMALCLAESLVECQDFDSRDQMERYLRWYQHGHLSSNGRCFDIGSTTLQALHRFMNTGEPYSGSTDPNTAGNGSLMRLAPIPMAYARQPAWMLEQAANSSRTTHGAQAAVDACRYFSGLVAAALNGVDKEAFLASHYSPLAGAWQAQPLHPAIDEVASGTFKTRKPPQIKGAGFVVRSLEAALWAFYHSTNFRDGCLMAVNLGDDADTTAAVYGQLAGAYYGENGIPVEWRSRLALRETIEDFAGKLLALAENPRAHNHVNS